MVDIYLPLAVLQMEAKALDPGLRQIVLQMLDDENVLEVWAEAGDEVYEKRKAALEQAKQHQIPLVEYGKGVLFESGDWS